VDSKRLQALKRFSAKYSLKFSDYSLLSQALTHSSYLNEAEAITGDNQRMEYLGDSVLGLVVNDYLYKKFPHYTEGQLAKIKSHVVSEKSLAVISEKMKIGGLLLIGKGEMLSGGRDRPSIQADALEALIASVYLDQGLEKCKKFVIAFLGDAIDSIKRPDDVRDSKSRLQEIIQIQYNQLPVYRVISETGPDHERSFICGVSVNGKEIARGKGRSKKQAEKKAASEALKILEK